MRLTRVALGTVALGLVTAVAIPQDRADHGRAAADQNQTKAEATAKADVNAKADATARAAQPAAKAEPTARAEEPAKGDTPAAPAGATAPREGHGGRVLRARPGVG